MQDQSQNVIGIVSNCWKCQLDQGQSLIQLIDQALASGFPAIELRQGYLGEFEADFAEAHCSESSRQRISDLSKRFSTIDFDLAIDVPFFGGQLQFDSGHFPAGIEAAKCLSQNNSPHLRLVDTSTRSRDPDSSTIETAIDVLTKMARRLIQEGGRLSVEHAYQSWDVFQFVMPQARQQLGPDADRLRYCFDPCNLLLTEPPERIPAIVDSISPADVSMIHIKQRRHGLIQPVVADGDLPWPALLESLTSHGHHGPWLFEIAPDANVWSHLEQSRQFVLKSV
jgi:sugar phosphate isomerase/epimerase